MAGTEDKGRAHLMRVFLGVAAGSILLAVVPQLLNHYYGTQVDLSVWAFVAMLLAGLLGAAVYSLGVGSALGAVCGMMVSVAGGVAFLILEPGERGADWRTILSGVPILAVSGLVLGLLGGLPVWTFRKLSRKEKPSA